jgi:hypothetical protein
VVGGWSLPFIAAGGGSCSLFVGCGSGLLSLLMGAACGPSPLVGCGGAVCVTVLSLHAVGRCVQLLLLATSLSLTCYLESVLEYGGGQMCLPAVDGDDLVRHHRQTTPCRRHCISSVADNVGVGGCCGCIVDGWW